MRTIYLDGRYFNVRAQIIDALTPGHFKVKGVFETMLGIDGAVLDMALHIKRLRQGLKDLKIKPPLINPLVFKKLLVANKLFCARVRIMVWQDGRQAHVVAVAMPYKIPVKKSYRVCLIKTARGANNHAANIKSLDYGLFLDAYTQARKQGYDEALLLNRNGYIFEASRANIFWIKENILYTPPLSSGCLKGIARQQVIRQAKNLKAVVKEQNLTLKILKEADCAFLTNSLLGIKSIDLTTINKL